MTTTQRDSTRNVEESLGGAIFCMLVVLWIVVYLICLP